MAQMEDHKAQTVSTNLTGKIHKQSSFPSMMLGYMSGDKLSKCHVQGQMPVQSETFKQSQADVNQFTETKGTEIKNRKLKKQQTYHGEIIQLSQQLQHRQVKSKSKADGEDALDKEEQENLKKLKEKEHDDLIQGLLMLRDYYKAEYKKALKDKVEQQRKAMQKQQQKLKEQAKISEQNEKEKCHKVPHKLPRSVLISDRQVRDSLMQTDYYKIINFENKLKKEGYLIKMHEVNEFWNFITVPENLANAIKDGGLTWEKVKNYHREFSKASLLSHKEAINTSAEPKIEQRMKGPLKGASAVSTWRSTIHGIRTILTPSSPFDIANGRNSSRKKSKKTPPASAIPIEQRFPKVEFPPLAAYRLEFGEPEADPEEVRKKEQADKRLKARNGLKRTVNTMFSHALANRAATQRLMDKNDDYNFESLSGAANFEEFHELVNVQRKQTGSANKNQQSRKSSSKSAGWKSRVGSHTTASKSRKSSVTDTFISDRSDSNLSHSSKEEVAVELPPLCLDQLRDNCVEKEAKCLSTFWVNPTRTAKQDVNSLEY
ncbi:DNA ligase 1-like [Montipora capricornis]|uniref:DNA ligase 1-like n=1 Tax=Montipora foliosa TaxID=591990 RepID=UPI0035F206F7